MKTGGNDRENEEKLEGKSRGITGNKGIMGENKVKES